MPSASIDVETFLDSRPFGRLQLLVASLCGFIAMIDGFDAQIMGFVAPSMVAELHISRAALGPVFSAGLLGMVAGSLICGPMADRFGRRPLLLLCLVWFGIWSLVTATAASVPTLIALRFMTGLGLGGAMPNASALTAEYAPTRHRATAVMLMYCGFSVGAALGGIFSSVLVSDFGWPSVFVFGGAVPLVLAILIYLWLPESVRFLAVLGKRAEELTRLLGRLRAATEAGPAPILTASEGQRPVRLPVSRLFADGRTRMTLLLWVMFVCSYLDLYFLNSWLPTMIHDAGLPIRDAVLITSAFQIGGTAGTVVLGRIMDRLRPAMVLGWTFLGASVCVFLIGWASSSEALLIGVVSAAGVGVVGGIIGLIAMAAQAYPTAIRSTGLGWAIGNGRIGGVIGPMVGGVLLSAGWQAETLLQFAAVPALVAALASFAILMVLARRPADGQGAAI